MPFNVTSTVTGRGPVFDGRAARALDRFEIQLRADVGNEGTTEVGRETIVFKRPTGNYLRNITTTNRVDSNVVHLDGVVYDAWIEGTSRRNQTTRFKGYKVFRKATQALAARVPEIARTTLRPYLRDMGGK